MPKIACLNCGIPSNGYRCENCAQAYAKKYAWKPSSAQRGYDAQWRKVRLQVLDRDHWTCYICNKKLVGNDATVDHLVALSKDYEQRLNPDNLRACCRSCNSAKKNK